MRIDRLWLGAFRNLINFDVDFDEGSARQVIVGRNGVGKSNLLEAITTIFRDLDLELTSSFEYEIEYFCNGCAVKIICRREESRNLFDENAKAGICRLSTFAAPEDKCGPDVDRAFRPYRRLTQAEFFSRNKPDKDSPNPDRLLPQYVFGYYSGSITRFAKLFEKHEEKYYEDQIKGEEAPLRPLFLAQPHHSQFALLAFYASQDVKAQEFLLKECRIKGFNSALFALRQPVWKIQRKGGDPRFWYVAGKVSPFLRKLFECALAPMAASENIRLPLGKKAHRERRYCFIPNIQVLQEIAQGWKSKDFFARLESMVFSDVIDRSGEDVRVWVDLEGVDEPASFLDLAEGERQLLTVLGLLRFTAEREALFLLDEPDTHLNPAWCLDYLKNLTEYGSNPEKSQIILTTHSPLTFAGLEKNEVVILERARTGSIYAEHPVSAPRGLGFDAILTSEFFGLRSALDRETVKKLDRKRSLALKEDKTEEEYRELVSLDEELGKLDFTHAVRDPLYLEFVRAMTKAQQENPALADDVPDKTDWRTRQDVAADIARFLVVADEDNVEAY